MANTKKANAEDKYKLVFLQIDKRVADLELAIGELSEKIKEFDSKAINDLQEKVDSLENFVMVENLGMLELKKIIEKRFKEIPKETVSLSTENLDKIVSSIMPKIENRVFEIEEKLSSELKNIKEKIVPFDQEIIQKIVSEVSDLRTEVSKEIRYIKEKIEGERATKSDIDLKFLSSRVNTLKESVDFLLNRKVEIDQKIQNIEKSLARVSEVSGESIPESVIESVENTKKELLAINTKINTMEKSIKNTSEKISKIDSLIGKIEKIDQELKRKLEEVEKIKEPASFVVPKEIDKKLTNLEERLNLIESKIKEEKERIFEPRVFGEIKELIDKIVVLETRIGALERTLQELMKIKPVILE